MTKKQFKISILLLSFVLLLSMVLPMAVFAKDDASVTIRYNEEGISFALYHVATQSGKGFVPTEAYADYSLSWNPVYSSDWRALASTLAVYIERDSLAYTVTGKTGSDYSVTFSKLASGMYLVMGESDVRGDYTYIPTPFLIVVEKGQILSCNAKYTTEYHGKPAEYGSFSVTKVWKDNDSDARPNTITVQLLQNGNVYETVVLSAKNNWQYTWPRLDTSYSWSVMEQTVPQGYTVAVEQEDNLFTITNTLADIPDVPETTDTDTTTEPDEPDTTTEPDEPDTTAEPDEPDTADTTTEPVESDTTTEPDITDNPDTTDAPDRTDVPDTPDTPDEPKTPQTSDPFNMRLYVVLIAVSFAILIALVLVYVREKKCE